MERQLNALMTNSTTVMSFTNITGLLSYSNVHFLEFLRGAAIPLEEVPAALFYVNFPTSAFYRSLNNSVMTSAFPSNGWIQYARYKMLNAAAPYLAQGIFSAFTYAHFPVREQDPDVVMHTARRVAQEPETLSAQDPRYITCRTLANNADIAQDLLSAAFMDRQFNSTAYAIVQSMVADIRSAWTEWLPSIDWLDAPGRVAFQQKMDNMKTYIGGAPLLPSYAKRHQLASRQLLRECHHSEAAARHRPVVSAVEAVRPHPTVEWAGLHCQRILLPHVQLLLSVRWILPSASVLL